MPNFLCIILAFLTSVSSLYIENNGYRDITIAFSPSLKQTDVPFENLKRLLQKSSENLFQATGRRAYLSSVILLLPTTWENICEEYDVVKKSPKDISVYVTNPREERSNKIRAQHSRKCGEKGEIMHLPNDLLKGDIKELSREFVQQWAIYRYGVFEEKADDEQSCFTKDGVTWIPSSCYNIDISISNITFDENGLPLCSPWNDLNSYEGMRSSFMSPTRSETVLDFCDGSTFLPHNPIIPTRQNMLCGGRPIWNVIKESDDFRFGRLNTPIQDDDFKPSVSFQCYVETRDHLIFAVQTQSLQNIEWIMVEIRTSLLRFFIYDIPREVRVSLIAYNEGVEGPFRIDPSSAMNVSKTVKSKIRTADTSTNVNLLGGLREAINASRADENVNNVMIFIALASAFKSQNLFDFVKEIQSSSEVYHIVVIQDTKSEVLPSNLIHVIHMKGGRIYMIPGKEVILSSKLSLLLPTVLRGPVHPQDKTVVIYHALHLNIIGSLQDEFTTDLGLKGEMFYTVTCNSGERLIHMPNCVRDSNIGEKLFCSYTTTLTTKMITKKWDFKFEDRKTMDELNCFTMVTVRLDEDAKSHITIRGWLSGDRIHPRQNALIVYVEVMQDDAPVTNAQVTAEIYSSSENPPTVIELWDTGNGDPDVYKGDGIYSKYFTQIQEKGMHLVVIRVTWSLTADDENTTKSMTEFMRTTAIGSFEVIEKVPEVNFYPPSRVGDLKVVAVNHTVSTVTLQWTAPGADYDHGIVKSYEVFYSADWKDLMIHDSVITSEQLHPLQDFVIQESGKLQREEFKLPEVNESTLYCVTLRAVDEYVNHGTFSNIVTFYIHRNNTLPTVATATLFTDTESKSIHSCSVGANYKILAYICGGVFSLLLVLNLILWIVCVHKQKENKDSKRTIKHHLKEISSIAERELQSINTLSSSSANIVDHEATSEPGEHNFSTLENDHDCSMYATSGKHRGCIEDKRPYEKDQIYSSVTKKRTSKNEMIHILQNVKENDRKYCFEKQKPTNENDKDMGFV